MLKEKKVKNFIFLFQKTAKGKGNAVREALSKATGEIIMIQDADLEYDFKDYIPLLNVFINDKSVDLVIGNRERMRNFGNFGLRAFYMNIGQHFFHTFFRILYGVNISDPTTMFKIFKKSAIKDLKFECNRFDFDWELICKLTRKKVKFLEIPVSYNSRGYDEGKKVGLFIDPIIWIYKIVKYRFVKV